MGHPQSNGEAEVTNRTIFEGLKIRLTEIKGLWEEELYSVLWVYKTTPRRPIEETSFKLTFEAATVIPIEIDLPMIRTENFHEESNSDRMRINLNLLDKIRERAPIRMVTYK